MDFVQIVEVAARDGLQNERAHLGTEAKLSLIARARAAGLVRQEVASFVNPRRVPQMADADAVATGLPEGVRGIGLALNVRGAARAAAAGLPEATFVVVASETFNRRNQGVSTHESVAAFAEARAAAPGVEMGVVIGAAFGCPFEGEVPPARLMAVIEALAPHAPAEISLADTIGVAAPPDVTARVRAVRAALPEVPLRLHLHDTRGTGLANAWAGLDAGVRRLDASLGGAGGCPFAPDATGNVATEDLAYMLGRGGVETGVDLGAAIAAARWLEAQLRHPLPGRVMRAGGFPAP